MRGGCLGVALVAIALALATWPALCLAREAGWVPVPTAKAQQPAQSKKNRAAGTARTQKKMPAKAVARPAGLTVYEKQAPITDREVGAFVELLPRFRRWARQNSETASPVLNEQGKPDFIYSAKAAQWVRQNGFEPDRFFCVMGKMAAGLVIVEEGNDYQGTRPPDMPEVTAQELELARRHLGELLSAGGPPPPINGD